MPFFSFILNSQSNKELVSTIKKFNKNIDINKKYFSKNTNLWKILSNKKNRNSLDYIKAEKRTKLNEINDDILFCLPPNIGLGDAIEYAFAIKSVVEQKNKFSNYGIAFVGKYKIIFEKYFNLNNVYDEVISEKEILKYNAIFHFTLEIDELKFQKYNRLNIENVIVNFFRTNKYRFNNNFNVSKFNKIITIFPVSKSPVRTMPHKLLNNIISFFSNEYSIEIVLDNGLISKYIKENIKINNNCKLIIPENLNKLCQKVKNTKFGIFMDSGPLHLAKIFNIKGILIISSVDQNILLDGFKTIKSIKGNYKSKFCNGPCGLTNAFNYKNEIGCYDSLKIKKDFIINLNNFKELQRGKLKKNYINLMRLGINCLTHIDSKEAVKLIKKTIDKENE